MNKKPKQFLYLAIIGLSLLISSCDGGLFGTGDGENHNANIMVGADTSGSTDTEANGDASNQSIAAFDNMQPGSQSSVPQLRVLNLSQINVQVAVNNNGSLVADLAPEQDSGNIALPIDATRLLFTDSANPEPADQASFHIIEPFNAAEFSITTIILRPEPNDDIGVIALATQAEASSASTALIRLVQTSTLGDAAGDTSSTSTITLTATEPNNSGSDVSFEGLSFDTAVTEYLDVLAGSYTLTDADGRFASETVTIEAGRVYTIVINSATAPVLRVIDDSE